MGVDARKLQVRVFYSLLALSVLEVAIWSFCLVGSTSTAPSTQAVRAYYTRETVNFNSTTGAAGQSFSPRFERSNLERVLALALKAEGDSLEQRSVAQAKAASSQPGQATVGLCLRDQSACGGVALGCSAASQEPADAAEPAGAALLL